MQGPTNRSVLIISGLLTLLALGGGTLAVAFHNDWLRVSGSAPSPDAVIARAQPGDEDVNRAAPAAHASGPSASSAHAATADDAAVYRQKLEESYRALDDAYAQIRSLQTAQSQRTAAGNGDDRFAGHDEDDDDRERRSHRRESEDD